jgi:formylglycine-generating enzyme required for sulfatase activity
VTTRPVLVSLLATLLALAVSGCEAGAALPSERPTAEPGMPSTVVPTLEGPSLGDTITRPGDDMVMAYVPAGEFEIGSTDSPLEQPIHTVVLDSFWIDRTEVSNVQYQQCVEVGVCTEPNCWEGTGTDWEDVDFNGPEQPVVCVNWYMAQAYCGWVEARLPTEAEWEYAARGPDALRYPWGDEFEGTLLNYCDVNCPKTFADERFNDNYAYTAPVGSYPDGASWCGALDMAGNVWEWASDWFGKYPAAERRVNPSGPPSGVQRVILGGAWNGPLFDTRSAVRKGGREGFEIIYLGFRCASSVPPSPGH